MAKIYIASDDVVLGFAQHVYFVYDINGDPYSIGDQYIIRGGPQLSGFPWGSVIIEPAFPSLSRDNPPVRSLDSLDSDGDGNADLDPFLDRHYTELPIPSDYNADSFWIAIKDFVTGLGTAIPSGDLILCRL